MKILFRKRWLTPPEHICIILNAVGFYFAREIYIVLKSMKFSHTHSTLTHTIIVVIIIIHCSCYFFLRLIYGKPFQQLRARSKSFHFYTSLHLRFHTKSNYKHDCAFKFSFKHKCTTLVFIDMYRMDYLTRHIPVYMYDV